MNKGEHDYNVGFGCACVVLLSVFIFCAAAYEIAKLFAPFAAE